MAQPAGVVVVVVVVLWRVLVDESGEVGERVWVCGIHALVLLTPLVGGKPCWLVFTTASLLSRALQPCRRHTTSHRNQALQPSSLAKPF